MTAVITLDEAKERIRRLAEERPDYVYTPVATHSRDDDGEVCDTYESCRYFDNDGNPSCIIGHAFADELRALDYSIEGRSALSLLDELGAEYATQRFAQLVQAEQDSGAPWGEAYASALRAIEG